MGLASSLAAEQHWHWHSCQHVYLTGVYTQKRYAHELFVSQCTSLVGLDAVVEGLFEPETLRSILLDKMV